MALGGRQICPLLSFILLGSSILCCRQGIAWIDGFSEFKLILKIILLLFFSNHLYFSRGMSWLSYNEFKPGLYLTHDQTSSPLPQQLPYKH